MSLRASRRVLSVAIAAALGTALAGVAASPTLGDQVGDHQVGDRNPQAGHSDRNPQASQRDLGTDPAYPGSVLHVSVSGPLQAGKVLTINASGSNVAQTALGGPALDFGLEVIVIDPKILKGPCEVSEQKELTDITNVPNGGRLLNFDDLNEGSSGPFKVGQPYEPAGFGPLLVCAYSKYVTDDAAYASTQVQIKPAARPRPAGPRARPRSLARPVVRILHGRLSCTRGRWSNRPTRFRYRWKIGSARFGSARTSGRLAVPAHSKGKTVTCAVSASNARGSGRATSRPRRLA
jgi:hypothetical protein